MIELLSNVQVDKETRNHIIFDSIVINKMIEQYRELAKDGKLFVLQSLLLNGKEVTEAEIAAGIIIGIVKEVDFKDSRILFRVENLIPSYSSNYVRTPLKGLIERIYNEQGELLDTVRIKEEELTVDNYIALCNNK